MSLKVAIRADASVQMGSGHVMRCLTLADALRERGAEVAFISREHPGNLFSLIEASGHLLLRLPEPTSAPNTRLAHAAWLGTTQTEDAQQTAAALRQFGDPDWLIVDHYAIDAEWETMLRPLVGRIMVIDDLADRHHDCDLLLDQNLQSQTGQPRYEGLLPPAAIKLIGPRYALLRAEFRKARGNLRVRDGVVRNILVFFGGSDPTNETGKALFALRQLDMPEINIHVVVGGLNAHKDEIRTLCMQITNAKMYHQVDNMADLMASSDLALGAAGGSTWERCCVGLPSIVWSIAENQNSIAQCAAEAGVCITLGNKKNVSPEVILNALGNLKNDADKQKEIIDKSLDLVDGNGVFRVLVSILPKLKISVVSDSSSWLNRYIPSLLSEWKKMGHETHWLHCVEDIGYGDCVFFLGCCQIASREILSRSVHNLVVHESALPRGRGWSPLTWQILEGKNTIPIVLFEAASDVDSGNIYLTDNMNFNGMELIHELRAIQAEKTVSLCRQFVLNYPVIVSRAKPQKGDATYYPRRTKKNSELDVDKTLREQFNLLRVVDNDNYPAFMIMNGKKYIIRIELDHEG